MTTKDLLAVFVQENKSMTKYDVELRFPKVAIFRIWDAITLQVKAGLLERFISNSGKVHYKITQEGIAQYHKM